MPSRDANLDLFPEEALPPPAETPRPDSQPDGHCGAPVSGPAATAYATTPRPAVQWLALVLPALPREALALTDRGVAVLEQRRVVAVDAAAAAHGVTAGQSLDTALALCPALHCHPRRERREREALEALAARLSRFSSRISLEPPDALLVEIGASLRLFGGRRVLLRRILHAAGEAFTLYPATAPTPTAALWLARGGVGAAAAGDDGIARLSALPLTVCRWPVKTIEAFAGMGVHTLGECLRLPRDGLARRFGPECVAALDRALGRRPDPRLSWQGRTRFHAGLDLPAETVAVDRLVTALEHLLASLAGFLRARQAGVTLLRLALHHAQQPATLIEQSLTTPSRDPGHCLALLQSRLQRLRPGAPVIALVLDTAPLVALADGPGEDLFTGGARTGDAAVDSTGGVPRLVERLRARLGVSAVYGLCPLAEHRPEAAWRRVDEVPARVQASRGGRPRSPRPLWMLAEPVALAVRDGRPRHDGSLVLVRGPERIETGWWDGRDVARDYYVAVSSAGSRLWIYRDRRGARGWFLHGVFG